MLYTILNLNTGKADNASDFMPEFKEGKVKKDGTPYAGEQGMTIAQQQAMWFKGCALDPITAKILLVTTMDETMDIINMGAGMSEPDLIEWTWNKIYETWARGAKLVTHNGDNYDLPMLITRSIINGIIPYNITDKWGFKDWILDTGPMWLSKKSANFAYEKRKWSVDIIARALGLGGKDGTGAMFEEWWFKKREKALSFATQEIMLQREIYLRLATKRQFEKKTNEDFFAGLEEKPERGKFTEEYLNRKPDF